MKRLIPKLILIGVISVLPLLAYNVIVDPYSVIRKDYSSFYICPNERFAKSDYILQNKKKYDGFLFGSSRVSQVPVSVINRATGRNYYNMTIVSGVVSEYLKLLKFFLDRGVTVKSVLVGLDYFSFMMLPLPNVMRSVMYPANCREHLKFYYTYLTLEPDSGMLYEIHFDGKDAFYDIMGTGEYHFLKREAALQANPAEHEAKFKGPVPTVCRKRIDETVAELDELISICRERGIELKIFLNPGYINSYLCDDIEFMNTVRRRLVKLSDFWDFSGPSSVTGNSFNYIDIIHFRRQVGEMMVRKMFNLRTDAPADFGYHIDRSNIDAYLKKAERDYAEYNERIRPPCIKCRW
ncbi:MAG: hypothetical protein JW807_03620 [Spirochaetes bacterium]|nr:hypothetical protein [Spirochaetota bacterium]